MFRTSVIALDCSLAGVNATFFGVVGANTLPMRLDSSVHRSLECSNITHQRICQPINKQYLGNLIISIIGGFGEFR